MDRGGYDLIAEVNGCLRHIRIKGSALGSKTARQKVHVALADKPSGCVVWVYLNEEDWALGPFLYFGGEPGKPMQPLGVCRIWRTVSDKIRARPGECREFTMLEPFKPVDRDTPRCANPPSGVEAHRALVRRGVVEALVEAVS